MYEKVDGENARIILLQNKHGDIDYLIGSREELLYAKGDRIGNPYGHIADFLKPLAERVMNELSSDGNWALTVIYQESYGGKTKAAKQYTGTNTQGSRVFDVFSLDADTLDRLLGQPQEKLAEWREHGHQPFYAEDARVEFLDKLKLPSAPLLTKRAGSDFPVTLEDTFSFLNGFQRTQVGLDAAGRSEGIIVRTSDRRQIRKIRFEDYERTFQK
ncbi:RNA ligase family protein [Paenibacillus caseinilyticus]|uniref:RNA ligase family protein n=1 Tax=Paenibacillus caseinilyticus TaxID=3098138 RepID=UPI0022B86D94|nr:RNA ligase family protein [Paenibacillus caseinilyticus]